MIVVALLTACAPGGTSAEDGRRLATLKAEPLLEQLEDFGTLLHASNEAGAEDGPAGVENPTSVARTYRLNNNQPHAAGIEVASLADAHGWNGALSCASATGAVFSGFKKFEKWDAHISAVVSNRLGDTRLVLKLATPHVSRRD